MLLFVKECMLIEPDEKLLAHGFASFCFHKSASDEWREGMTDHTLWHRDPETVHTEKHTLWHREPKSVHLADCTSDNDDNEREIDDNDGENNGNEIDDNESVIWSWKWFCVKRHLMFCL